MEDTGTGVLFKKIPNTLELLGSGASHASAEEMKKLLDEARAEKE
ncbi:MAG TPA: hypothetical protein VN739_09695 [Nitrososphaerales archaeon]|nr:hypothetical protein [Nitrososphaerales archaeon]